MSEEPLADGPQLEAEEGKKERKILILFRFVFVPLLVVGVVIFIIVLFGNLALKEKSVKDYLYDIRSGSKSERWQAAYHLSNLMANPKKDYEEQARKNLIAVLRKKKFLSNAKPDTEEVLDAVLRYLAKSPAETVLVTLEDLWQEERSQNVPGTSAERPNWRRKARYTIEELRASTELQARLRKIMKR